MARNDSRTPADGINVLVLYPSTSFLQGQSRSFLDGLLRNVEDYKDIRKSLEAAV
jgi:hypothetical protein